MAKDITLLWVAGSPPCWRVMIALEEKNLQGYNQKLLSFEKGEHKSKEVMDINPRGQVPAFKYKDYILNESYAACFFLECQHKAQGNDLTPQCPKELAQMYQRMFEGLNISQKGIDVIAYNWRVPEGERHESAQKRNKEALTEELKLWEGYLQQGPYLAGKTFSLADVVVFPSVAILYRFGLCEKRYPNLAKYYNCLKERPSIKASWPPKWDEDIKGGPPRDLLKDI
ncbi:glutathione S-transferase A-like [Pholidichthys leucotaenia]